MCESEGRLHNLLAEHAVACASVPPFCSRTWRRMVAAHGGGPCTLEIVNAFV